MGLYDEVEIEDMDWNEEMQGFTYSCPCGDLFQVTVVSPGVPPSLISWQCCDAVFESLLHFRSLPDRFPRWRATYTAALCTLVLMASIAAAWTPSCYLRVWLQDELLAGEDIARCPSCSLFVQVIYDQVKLAVSALKSAASFLVIRLCFE